MSDRSTLRGSQSPLPHQRTRLSRTLAAVTATLVLGSGLALSPGVASPSFAASGATIQATVKVGGSLSLAEGTSALLPEALKLADGTIPVGGSGGWSAGAPSLFDPASGTFSYRIYEHGARTAYSVQGEAHRLVGGSADSGSCSILRDDASGTPTSIDQAEDSPYECDYLPGFMGPGAIFKPVFTVAPLVWSTVRAVFTPGSVHGTTLSLMDGKLESSNEEFLVNGARQADPAPLDTVATGTSSTFAAFLRNAEGNDLNSWARGDFTYRIVEDGSPTPFWIQGHVSNWRGSTFEHDGVCKIYQGNPLPDDGEPLGAEVTFAPYTCEGVGTNIDGRGDWQVNFDIEPLPYTAVSGAQATDLISRGCADDSSSCVYFPRSIEPVTKGEPILIASEKNFGEEGIDKATFEYHDERALYNSFSISMSWEAKSSFLIESLKTTLEVSYEFEIKNVTGHVWSYDLEVPPRSKMTAWLTPAYHRITGDFFFMVDGKYFRAKNTWVDVPDSMTPGEVDKHTTPLTDLSELPPEPTPEPKPDPTPEQPLTPVTPVTPDGGTSSGSDPSHPVATRTGSATHALATTGGDTNLAAIFAVGAFVLALGSGLFLVTRRRQRQIGNVEQ